MIVDPGRGMGIYTNLGTVDAFNQQKAFFEKSAFGFTRIADIRLEHPHLDRGLRLFSGLGLLNNQVAATLAEMNDVFQAGLDALLEKAL